MKAKAIVLVAIVAPWLALTPLASTGLATAALYSLTLLATFHGWGIAAYRRTDPDPLLAIATGIAVVVAIAGLAIALHRYTAVVQAAVVFGGAALHSWALASRFKAAVARIESSGIWIVPVLVLALLALVQILGGAGDLDTRSFDDDGNVFGQLRRLMDTGGLADPIGFAREAQLGGSLGLGALANIVGDPHAIRMIDGLGFALVLGLAIARLRPRDIHGAMLATLLAIAAAALAFSTSDPVPTWIAAALIVALFESDELLPIALIAGALITLRLAYAPIALAGLFAASRRDWRRLVQLLAIAAVVVAPYAIARIDAWAGMPALARTLTAPPHRALLVELGPFVLLTAIATPLLVLIGAGLRWPAFATAMAISGITTHLTGEHYNVRFLWAIAIAFVLLVVIRAARADSKRQSIVLLVVTLLACLFIDEGRETSGRLSWGRRNFDLFANIEHLRHVRFEGPRDGYDLIDLAPPGTKVAVWVMRPDELDYSAHRIIDLRTPHLARLRDQPGPKRELEALLIALHARYLLVEDDGTRQRRLFGDLIYWFACRDADRPACADAFEVIATNHRVVAHRDGLELIELAPSR